MMGCSTSRIDHLPAVSLCHDRCKFLEEALCQSYAVADAHVAYMQSLKSLGPALHRFFDQNLDNNPSDSQPNVEAKSSPSPDRFPSSSNSESHLDFPSDSEDEESGEKDFELLHSIHTNYFETQNPTPPRSDSYPYYSNNGGLSRSHSPYGASSPDDGSAWKTPSPPPPPRGSTWEFLNFFDTYERYDLPTKDKEGIHVHKDEFQNEIRGKDKFGGDSMNFGEEKKQSKPKMNVKREEKEKPEKEGKKEKKDSEVIKELEAQFVRAAESGNEVLKILDTGKFRYYDKNSIYQGVSSKMFHVVSASFLVIRTKNTNSLSSAENIRFDEDSGVMAVNLSFILKKLCMWEKKLYDEVKGEEKLRMMLARNYGQMKNMGGKGGGDSKVDSARTLIRALSTNIKVAIQVIDRTSIAINKIRDEELWPLITQLIHKLLGMWKAMAECHRCQSQAVVEAKSLDAILSNGNFNETHMESAIQLKIELQNWNLSFSNWITAQRCYVRALNNWLLKCLPHQPEEIPDETPPSSPGKAEAPPPPVFAFCNQWSDATGRVSEIEVVNAINGFFLNINQLVERHYVYLQQKLSADRNLEKRMKILEKKEKMMQRILQARGKKIGRDINAALFPGGAVHQSEVTHNTSLHLGLKQIFMAVEKLSVNNVQVYEELHVHIKKGSNLD